jgi:hypothetical protein
LIVCLIVVVDNCWAKSSGVRKMMKLKMNSFFIICFDDQNCYLQTGLNNLFDGVSFISNSEGYFPQARPFQGFTFNHLIFSANGRE